jgi:hypothetical protein
MVRANKFHQTCRGIGDGKGRQHRCDDGGTGPIYAGLAQLFRLLRNSSRPRVSYLLGPCASSCGTLAAMENYPSSSGSWVYVPHWLGTQPVAAAVPGTSPTPRPYPSRFPRPISNRSVSRIWRMCTSVTISNRRVRTRTHGGVAGVSGQPLPLCRSSRLLANDVYHDKRFSVLI